MKSKPLLWWTHVYLPGIIASEIHTSHSDAIDWATRQKYVSVDRYPLVERSKRWMTCVRIDTDKIPNALDLFHASYTEYVPDVQIETRRLR
jgi:hypothetical protein